MMPSAAKFRLVAAGGGLRLSRPGSVGLAVDRLMTGRRVADVERLLPAIFGLCHSVQEAALALALNRPMPDPAPLRRDMIRDHLARLCLHLPPLLGLPPLPLPQGWAGGGAVLRQAIFAGPDLPQAADLMDWIRSGRGISPLLARVADAFAPQEGTASLPDFDPAMPMAGGPVENSLIVRHALDARLKLVLESHGSGPLAHLVARLIDLEALSYGRMPQPRRLADGTALIPCSRGICALRIKVEGDTVIRFDRRTPTDHLLMPGGLLEAALARLPAAKAGLAPVLIGVLDPCIPVTLEREDA